MHSTRLGEPRHERQLLLDQTGEQRAKLAALDRGANESQGRELVYAAHISLDRTAMAVDGSDVALSPGMAVTVEIKTGAQRVITYLLSPLLRFTHDSLHER